jgi:hypothetical protein
MFNPLCKQLDAVQRIQEARKLVREIVDQLPALKLWSDSAGKFVEDMAAKLAVERDPVVTEKQLNWLVRLGEKFGSDTCQQARRR